MRITEARFQEVFPLAVTPRHPLRAVLGSTLAVAAQWCGSFPLEAVGVRTEPMVAQDGLYDAARPDLGIRVADDAESPGLTLLHELAHVLDFQVLGGGTSWASHAAPQSTHFSVWQTLFAALEDTPTCLTLREHEQDTEGRFRSTRAMATYLRLPQELFARAYAQWVAHQSQHPLLLAELQRQALRVPAPQWPDAEFVTLVPPVKALLQAYGR